ncbi:malate dehydrogenase [Raineyella antarctica]|uniref:Malate dehydrogenase n=1 Tax=Raineyella antarctica TaxID=1577474 RepID=A0A1G6I115_9ACTN|nr:lactate dehydrogenase [Raineyella antarctica]SDC00249.1 malate dehydrogenase [Raineyella antarctica]
MDVAVIGATGAVGRQVCTQLIERRALPTTARLQLVGRRGGRSEAATHGYRADLIDAYDEVAPLFDVALDPEEVVADVVVVASGATIATRPGESVDRAALARTNHAMFAAYADALAEHGAGDEVVIVVTNPVELGVATMAARLGRHRVIGMGAWLDTLRFRREIAHSLGVRRQRIGGFVAGQHGDDAVPLWSSVRIRGLVEGERARTVGELRGGRDLAGLPGEIAAAQARLLAERDSGRAFAMVETWPPDLRTVTRPWLTHQSGARTAVGTANATVDLISALAEGREIVMAGQVDLAGEATLAGQRVHGVLGVPVVFGPEGWTDVLLGELPPDEDALLARAARRIAAVVEPFMRDGGRP